MNNSPKSKLALGITLLIVGVFLVFSRQNKQVSESLATFENEPVKVEGFKETSSEEDKIPTRIVVPKLSIDLLVKKSLIINGYWEVFEDSAAWGDTSGLPGEVGNQVIFAHVREGLFLPLKEIMLDDVVYVFTDERWYSYKVVEIKEVFPNQVEVIAPTEDETLTLYTCSGYQDTKRLIVVAKRFNP